MYAFVMQLPALHASRELLKHHQSCKDAGCPVCGPVRNAMLKQRQHAQMQMAHGNKRMKLDDDRRAVNSW